MFKGANYVGIGVSDMGRSLKFYGELLGFTEVMFDYTGSLPGMDKVTGKAETKARVVMLKNHNKGPASLGMIKLVQLLHPDKPEPCTVLDRTIWGDVGLVEVCFNTINTTKVFEELVERGLKAVLAPTKMCLPPHDTIVTFAYMRDPDNGGLLEFIDWEECKAFGKIPRVEGVNHLGFGVSDLETSEKFYRELGFTEIAMDFAGRFYMMASMFPGTPPKMNAKTIANYDGAWIEIIHCLPPYERPDFKESWGHLGPMEFGVGVTNLEKAYEELQKRGIRFLCPPQTVEVSSGQWKYAYMVEPDNLYVSLIEPRY